MNCDHENFYWDLVHESGAGSPQDPAVIRMVKVCSVDGAPFKRHA
jgi:hypothetical protein